MFPKASASLDSLFLVLRVVVSLAAVLGLLYILQRRIGHRLGRSAQRRAVTVVDRQGIGPKASVVVVDVEGRRYLLGVSDQAVNVIDSFEAPEADAPAESPSGAPSHATSADHGRGFALSLVRARGDIAEEAEMPATRRSQRRRQDRVAGDHAGRPASPLAGSILSPQTWRQATTAIRRGTGS